ncbi:MAG: flavodoxin family protein, partial [Deltaproteobacteria bacterium]
MGVITDRQGRVVPAHSASNHFISYSYLIGQMIFPDSTYWNFGYGLDTGEVEKDEEGIKTMKNLGVNMVWLLI